MWLEEVQEYSHEICLNYEICFIDETLNKEDYPSNS